MVTPIILENILKIKDPERYSLHLDCGSMDGKQPLDEYLDNNRKCRIWNEKQPKMINYCWRPRILAFIEFHPIPDTHLFGGAFEIIGGRMGGRYLLQELSIYEMWERRLLCRFQHQQQIRGDSFCLDLEHFIGRLEVHQVFPEPYSGAYSDSG